MVKKSIIWYIIILIIGCLLWAGIGYCICFTIQSGELRNVQASEKLLSEQFESAIATIDRLNTINDINKSRIERDAETIEQLQRDIQNTKNDYRELAKQNNRLGEANNRFAEFQRRMEEREHRAGEIIEQLRGKIEQFREDIEAIPETYMD
jgi:septation ring formation regulator EzrA